MEAPLKPHQEIPSSGGMHGRPRLLLEADNERLELCLTAADLADPDVEAPLLTLGKDPDNQLVWDGEFTSRHHAYIEIQRNDFYLVDESANGSFVQTEDEQIQYVHRSKVRLWGVGWISLGEPLHTRRPILFREVVPA